MENKSEDDQKTDGEQTKEQQAAQAAAEFEEKARQAGPQARKAAFDKSVKEKKAAKDAEKNEVANNSDAIFITLGGGTVMLTTDGEFRGVPQPGKMMISSQKVSKVDKEGQVKATYLPFSYSDTARLFQELKKHKEFIMAQVDKERAMMTSINMD